MTIVASYMSSPVFFTRPNKTCREALFDMYEKNVGALLVREGDQYIGIFTKADWFNKVLMEDGHSKKIMVSDIMSTQIITIEKDQPLEKASKLMNKNNTRHIVVTDNGDIDGILSIEDLEKYYLELQNDQPIGTGH
jgi:CBS domain-containing protein